MLAPLNTPQYRRGSGLITKKDLMRLFETNRFRKSPLKGLLSITNDSFAWCVKISTGV
jgi:hypothetical protein